jgi:hypothetical protein
MAKPISQRSNSSLTPPPIDSEIADANDGAIEGDQPLPKIDRRALPRISYRTTAWLAPADETAAIRRPIIRTRDLNPRCMGFLTRQDISALREAVLRLPTAGSRGMAIACKVRRSLELGNGWFDCLIEFLQPQPDLAAKHAQLCVAPVRKKSDNRRRRK